MATYTGIVTPRGLPDVRELEHVTITKYAVDPKMANNCYLLTSKPDGSNLLIDAADGAESLIQRLRRRPRHHRHNSPALGSPPRPGRDGGDDARDHGGRHAGRRRDHRADRRHDRPAGRRWRHGHRRELLARGDPADRPHPGIDRAPVRRPRGHPHLFTGDSLFPGGAGRTSANPRTSSSSWTTSKPRSSTVCPRDVVLPRPRRRLHPRLRATSSRRMARARLVTDVDRRGGCPGAGPRRFVRGR